MAITFPTTLDTLTNPGSGDYLNSPSHADQHSDENDAIEALEAKIGADSSIVTTSLDYLVKSTSSSNPGHKHTLVNGATDLVKAVGSELDTGTNDAKFVTAKAIKDSYNVPSVAPSTAGKIMTSNGTNWVSSSIGTFQSWTPVWTNFTKGNATIVAEYTQIGKLVMFTLSVTLGNTSSMGTHPSFTLPITSNQSVAIALGVARYNDSLTKVYSGYADGSRNLIVFDTSGAISADALLSATVPFTWTTGDGFWVNGQYQSI